MLEVIFSLFHSSGTCQEIPAFMKVLVQISRYGGRTRGKFQLLRRSDFGFFGPLRPNSLNRHAREFHFSGTRTLAGERRL